MTDIDLFNTAARVAVLCMLVLSLIVSPIARAAFKIGMGAAFGVMAVLFVYGVVS